MYIILNSENENYSHVTLATAWQWLNFRFLNYVFFALIKYAFFAYVKNILLAILVATSSEIS